MFYEALKDLTEYGKPRWVPSLDRYINSSVEGLILGGLAGGMCFPPAESKIACICIFQNYNLVCCFDVFFIVVQTVQVLVHISQLHWMSSKQECKYRDQL